MKNIITFVTSDLIELILVVSIILMVVKTLSWGTWHP